MKTFGELVQTLEETKQDYSDLQKGYFALDFDTMEPGMAEYVNDDADEDGYSRITITQKRNKFDVEASDEYRDRSWGITSNVRSIKDLNKFFKKNKIDLVANEEDFLED